MTRGNHAKKKKKKKKKKELFWLTATIPSTAQVERKGIITWSGYGTTTVILIINEGVKPIIFSASRLGVRTKRAKPKEIFNFHFVFFSSSATAERTQQKKTCRLFTVGYVVPPVTVNYGGLYSCYEHAIRFGSLRCAFSASSFCLVHSKKRKDKKIKKRGKNGREKEREREKGTEKTIKAWLIVPSFE